MSAFLGRINFDRTEIDAEEFRAACAAISKYGEIQPPTIANYFAMAESYADFGVAPSRLPSKSKTASVIVADAIVDNRGQLIDMLALAAEPSPPVSDSELIQLAFETWGEQCVQHLQGDFAFACFDPHKDEIILARDHIGSRPLYWILRDNQLLFGSSIESLVCFSDFEWKIDAQTVAEYLACPVTPVSKPFFQDVHSVPAGSFVRITKGTATTTRWWTPSVKPAKAQRTQANAIETCREILTHAVSDRVQTTKRIGSHFSGGLDSTGVAVIASRIMRQNGKHLAGGYAWSPEVSDQYPIQGHTDEREFIDRVAQAENIPVKYGHADAANFMGFVSRPFEFESEADLADELPVLRQAKQDDVKILLSGWGGDEVFSAHGRGLIGYFLKTGQIGQARILARETYRSPKRLRNLTRLVWREIIHPLLPGRLYHRWHPSQFFRHRTSFASPQLKQAYRDIFKTRVPTVKFGLNPNKNLKRHLEARHVTMRMESWAHWSAPFDIQYRYPLLDRRLLEFLFTLPPELLFPNMERRGLAKAVLSDCVPPEASKNDVANEKLRADVRAGVWGNLAQAASEGYFAGACPWIDKHAFLELAMKPEDQSKVENIETYIEVLAAARVWELYKRARAKDWL